MAWLLLIWVGSGWVGFEYGRVGYSWAYSWAGWGRVGLRWLGLRWVTFGLVRSICGSGLIKDNSQTEAIESLSDYTSVFLRQATWHLCGTIQQARFRRAGYVYPTRLISAFFIYVCFRSSRGKNEASTLGSSAGQPNPIVGAALQFCYAHIVSGEK